jgi:hypothetical protein
MVEHWQANGPPVYMAVAGYLGLIKTTGRKGQTDKERYGNLEELAAMFQSSGGMIQ